MTESRLRAIVDTAVDGIILMDGAGSITMFNPACERMFGYATGEVVGSDFKQLMPRPYRDEDIGAGVVREVVGRRKNGDTFPMDLSVGAAEQAGQPFFVGILRDVTERKRAEEQREKFIEQLAASNEEQIQFTHAASHDLREPLQMVAAFCGLLSRGYGDRLDDRGREFLALATSGTARMSELLDDLVDFGRLGLEAERGAWFSADEILDRVLRTFDDTIGEWGAEIIRSPLPRIYGNPLRFERLLQNLVGNALKYVAPGAAPRVQVRVERAGEFWRFSVLDNGIGVDPRHHERIFEPFKRLHSRTSYSGTGLGLTICRKIVDGFGGEMSVNSREGQGATFSFTIKVRTEEGDDGRLDY
jgi:two-component system sensor kinase FixL